MHHLCTLLYLLYSLKTFTVFRKTRYKTNNRIYDIVYVKAYTPNGEFFKGNMVVDAHVIPFSFSKNSNGVIAFHSLTTSKEFRQLIVHSIEKNEEDKSYQN